MRMSFVFGVTRFKSSGKMMLTVLQECFPSDKTDSYGLSYPFISKNGYVRGVWVSPDCSISFEDFCKIVDSRSPVSFSYDVQGNIIDVTLYKNN